MREFSSKNTRSQSQYDHPVQPAEFSSKNMHYVFNIEYFEDLDFLRKDLKSEEKRIQQETVKTRNRNIRNFLFSCPLPFSALRADPCFRSFPLYTSYPGLLMGVGNAHDASITGAISSGFSLDYVTGLPYLPGSSLKGILRSLFSYPELIEVCLNRDDSIPGLEKELFEHDDVFLGAYPISNGRLLDLEFITPHKEEFQDPIPITLLKVRPNVEFEFCFLLKDSKNPDISADEKRDLYEKLVLEMGIGAKSNVGFGRMCKDRFPESHLDTEKRETGSINVPCSASPPKKDSSRLPNPVDQGKATTDLARRVLGPCPNCHKAVVLNGRSPVCSAGCGMQFGRVFGNYISVEDYAVLLSGGEIVIPDFFDKLTGRTGPVSLRLNKMDSVMKDKKHEGRLWPRFIKKDTF